MKKLISLAFLAATVSLIGCNPDHSGDVQAPMPVTDSAPANKDPNIPAGVRSQLPNAGPATGK